MSYHIYTTKGIVLSLRAVGEADRIYSILTRDLGKLEARATGVRKNVSKLRGHIEPFSLSLISLVKGKDYWRLTSAEFIRNIPQTQDVAKSLALLEKLVQGEAPHPALFDAVEEAICPKPSIGQDDEMFEVNIVSKILYHLGYLKESDMALDKKSLVKAINEGIQASHL